MIVVAFRRCRQPMSGVLLAVLTDNEKPRTVIKEQRQGLAPRPALLRCGSIQESATILPRGVIGNTPDSGSGILGSSPSGAACRPNFIPIRDSRTLAHKDLGQCAGPRQACTQAPSTRIRTSDHRVTARELVQETSLSRICPTEQIRYRGVCPSYFAGEAGEVDNGCRATSETERILWGCVSRPRPVRSSS